MSSDARQRARELLAKPAEGEKDTPTLKWFKDHPDAAAIVVEYPAMVAAGETDWSVSRLHRELVNEHSFPYNLSTLSRYAKNLEALL